MVKRDNNGNILIEEFENYLKAQVRQEGYLEIMMYVPDTSIQIADVWSDDISAYSNISDITDLKKYSTDTFATLEENLWLLNGRFPNITDGTKVNSYISNSVSDEDGKFKTNPKITINLMQSYNVENFSMMLNPAVPTGYPKQVKITCFNSAGTAIKTITQNVAEIKTLPSINYAINTNNVNKLEIEFIETRYAHRRIRVSSLMFGKMVYIDNNNVLSSDFDDKTSYVPDTLPSRTFSFSLNNYDGIYDVDNPENSYMNLDDNTIVMFRSGYNTAGYELDDNGKVVFDDEGYPIVHNYDGLTEIDWTDWIELRLLNIATTAEESVTFECGSILDSMTDVYTNDFWEGNYRSVEQVVNNILAFCGLPFNTIEWSSDNITNINGTYTNYKDYLIGTVLPALPCRELLQLLAFSIGATILIKNNGKIKFANLDITQPNTFTNHYDFTYRDFESIPAAEQLESINSLQDISLPKYQSYLDSSKGEQVLATVTLSSVTSEVSYGVCLPTGAAIKQGDTSGASVQRANLYSSQGIITLGGLVDGKPADVEIYGYPVVSNEIQERNTTSSTLVLSTQLMLRDVTEYNSNKSIKRTECIKRKYLEWYKKKFKYTITTRGEPLVNAGDYATIKTQFSETLPVYILSNRWHFDGTWSGDMEVISLGN